MNQTTLFTFPVTLSAAYDQAVTMSFRTVNGTATTSNSDYIAKSGTLTFAPAETTKAITIAVKGDSKKEANETFYLLPHSPECGFSRISPHSGECGYSNAIHEEPRPRHDPK